LITKDEIREAPSDVRHFEFIRYELDDGDAGEEICYWKDMTLLPHLINLLSKSAPRAFVRFSQFQQSTTDRKELARQLHSEVLRLKNPEHAGAPAPDRLACEWENYLMAKQI